MTKVTKRQLEHKINLLSAENGEQHEYLMRIKRAFKSIDIDILSDNFDKVAMQRKTLDQSVFDELDEKWQWLGVNSDGTLLKATYKPKISASGTSFILLIGSSEVFGENYDTSNWKSSLIERDKVELTGNALCKAMLDRGDKIVLCAVSDASEEDALLSNSYDAISRILNNEMFDSTCSVWHYVVPINNQCRPLTASEVGL